MQMDRWLNYDFSTQVRAQMDGPWLRYRGQTQKWCAGLLPPGGLVLLLLLPEPLLQCSPAAGSLL